MSEDDWSDNDERDKFIYEMLHMVRLVKLLGVNPFFPEEIYNYIIEDAQKPPYIKDENWKRMMYPILYSEFTKLFVNTPISEKDQDMIPDDLISFIEPSSKEKFARFILNLSDNFGQADFIRKVLLKKRNIRGDIKNIQITPKNEDISILSLTSLCKKFYFTVEDNSESIEEAVNLYFEIMYPDNDYKEIRNFRIENRFVRDISKLNEKSKAEALMQIAKRLSLRRENCGRRSDINDHYIEQSREWRFYVGGARVHYIEDGDVVVITKYYSESQHDNYTR
ncbi:hypothetical protein DEIGR_102952 [Deinococcus grandis]|uniref:Uncharacterized protein n=1 Tax=Deinococcus grandis TaxID=57498 RepID=A0A100HNT6_9DEIO|nr:hypothetical protein [Deinococcus grandis]BBN93565.1 hypothetical protein DEGR_02980 [Deinococcus grandis]GAQ22925.1 hypothetical protein DEIGR_102952 [Deinococcus grandis]